MAWTHPFVSAFWYGQLVDFVEGRVVVAGSAPVVRTSVVLVPAPADPSDSGALEPYLRIDPGGLLPEVSVPGDAAVSMGADVDGWFGGMHVAVGVPYRVEVRRAGCPPVAFGVRTFRFLDFWSRRLRLEIVPCPLPCRGRVPVR